MISYFSELLQCYYCLKIIHRRKNREELNNSRALQRYTIIFEGGNIKQMKLSELKTRLIREEALRNSAPDIYMQGGAVNRGLKRFFSIHRPSCYIEAYIRPEKYCFVWAGPLANHPFNFNFIFLSDGLTAAAERVACFPAVYRR